jgi:hypothetical protein
LANPKDSRQSSLTPGAADNSADTDFSLSSQVAVKLKPPATLWDQKPWWCQPWTIVLSGLIAIAGSWLLLQTIWITALVFIGIVAWWLLFLVIVPRAFIQNQS